MYKTQIIIFSSIAIELLALVFIQPETLMHYLGLAYYNLCIVFIAIEKRPPSPPTGSISHIDPPEKLEGTDNISISEMSYSV